MMKRKIKQELEGKLKELKMNLENNYKDLAQDALQEYQKLLEEYRTADAIKEKDYKKYRAIADEYALRMRNYHH